MIPVKDSIESTQPYFVYGRLLDKSGIHKMEDIQIIILTKEKTNGELTPLIAVRTEPNGYFSFDYPRGDINAAVAQVGLTLLNNPIPIKLEEIPSTVGASTFIFPKRMVLVAEFPLNPGEEESDNESDCGCHSLNIDEKRELEEFSHFSLIRTSEPEIQGYKIEDEDELTLEDVLNNLPISGASIVGAISKLPVFIATRACAPGVNRPNDNFQSKLKNIRINKATLNTFLRDEKSIGSHNIEKLLLYNQSERLKKLTISKHPKPNPLGRVQLNAQNTIDWDDKPTIYQSVEVAFGHLLQFKTEWITDGYSLGDLLYSLPLAPG